MTCHDLFHPINAPLRQFLHSSRFHQCGICAVVQMNPGKMSC